MREYQKKIRAEEMAKKQRLQYLKALNKEDKFKAKRRKVKKSDFNMDHFSKGGGVHKSNRVSGNVRGIKNLPKEKQRRG